MADIPIIPITIQNNINAHSCYNWNFDSKPLLSGNYLIINHLEQDDNKEFHEKHCKKYCNSKKEEWNNHDVDWMPMAWRNPYNPILQYHEV